ncbi:caspase family protein [Aequorivita marisscotiae]|uniref:Caspase family protein n=1 Tax=Aequorivita marisscotiae TaxID=3040348 RepID=A0ABY8KSK2_9FLAO|nr:caspase family protein [Aequorivita sp. Ant34-E75]WGF92008.1 caspase family protein [Aequorivita sp. Ant34-E75]
MAKLRNAHALLIGVGKDLPESATDAKAIYNILASKEYGGYFKKNINLLTNKKATRKNILDAFEKLSQITDENSSVLIYYSGHGGTYSDNTFIKDEALKKPEIQNQKYFHLCPNDYDPNNYKTTWVKAEEIKDKIQQLKSRRLIFFLDCCHAAGMTAGVSSFGARPQLTNADGLAQNLDDGRGMTIVSACRANQLSYIMEGDENSLFTKCMLEVLKGENKQEDDEPLVRIFEVVQYLFKKVPQVHPEQNPYANLQIFEDFVVSFASNSIKNKTEITKTKALENSPKITTKEPVTKFRETKNGNSAILFIHGFSGDAENTFSEAPMLLMNNKAFDGWDMFPLGYSSNIVPEMGKNIWACASDIKHNSDYLCSSIKNKFSKYKRIAIIAHDLGGIVAQQALIALDPADLERISHVLFFATPSNGLPELALKDFFTYANDEKELKEGSVYIKNLRERWNKAFKHGYPFTFKTIAGSKDEYVPLSSSLAPFNKKYHELIEGSHFSIVQVENEADDGYQAILKTLTDKSFLNKFSNKEEINIALGEYKAVINSLLPKIKTLDGKGVERLIYALEGAGREEEAVKILEAHPLAKNNSNLLGILGGRYKRQYLKTFTAHDLSMTYKYYNGALKIAEAKNDYSQIYYHAINLAFVSLMKGERPEMTVFANKAYEATILDPFPSLWKFATVGEAYLYKGEFENSKNNYAKAAAMAGLREKLSIYTNAYNAYTNLMQTDNPKDVFVKFLRMNFLS